MGREGRIGGSKELGAGWNWSLGEVVGWQDKGLDTTTSGWGRGVLLPTLTTFLLSLR